MPPKMVLESPARTRPLFDRHIEGGEVITLDAFNNRALSLTPGQMIAELATLVEKTGSYTPPCYKST
jgi:hypothetical protein